MNTENQNTMLLNPIKREDIEKGILVEPGVYVCKISSAYTGINKNGNEFILIKYEILNDGDYRRRLVSHFLNLKYSRHLMLLGEIMSACDKESLSDLKSIKDKIVKVKVDIADSYKGGKENVICSVEPEHEYKEGASHLPTTEDSLTDDIPF